MIARNRGMGGVDWQVPRGNLGSDRRLPYFDYGGLRNICLLKFTGY